MNAAASQGYTFGSLHGERDEEYQFGVTMPYKGWSLDADTFRTRASNFFDHNNLGESNVFIPVTLTEALIRGWELTLRSPRLWNRTQLHLAYSNQIAEFRGNITGGLIPTDNTSIPDYIPLDHDQRNTLNVGAQVNLPWKTFVSGNVYYGSGFTNGNGPTAMDPSLCCSALDYLPAHTTVDLSVGKDFGEKFIHFRKRTERGKPPRDAGQQPDLWRIPLQQPARNFRRAALPLPLLKRNMNPQMNTDKH